MRRAALVAMAAVLGASAIAYAHPYHVYLRSASGDPIAAGGNVPYSPKQTCGICHDYESDAVSATKQQTVGGVAGAPYAVPVPSHGVSAGFHFQQGMNVAWGDTQRSFYGLPTFTSSPGMIGKY